MLRLLLVQEDRFDADGTCEQLLQSSTPTEVIRAGRIEALSLLADERLDGIFLDLDLCDAAAAEICRRAVATGKPVVGVVCTGDAAGRRAALAAGVTTCYFKRPGVSGIFRRLARNRFLANPAPAAAPASHGPVETWRLPPGLEQETSALEAPGRSGIAAPFASSTLGAAPAPSLP